MKTFRRLIRLWRRQQDERDIDAEFRLHVEMETEDLVRNGVPREEARRRALVAFGGLERFREEARKVRRLLVPQAWTRDTQYGLRALRRSPGFSLAVLLVLTIGIGATTAVFALLNSVVLRPLPFVDSQRFVVLRHSAPGLGLNEVGVSSGLYFHYREHARSLERLAAYSERDVNVQLPGGGTDRVHMTLAGVALFDMFGAKPAVGRLFTEDDGRPGFMNMTWPVPVLLAYDFWAGRLGADPAIVGRTIIINDRPRRVVGVLTADFAFLSPSTQVWMMFEVPPNSPAVASNFGLNVVAQLRGAATAASAEDELRRILPDVVGGYADATAQRMAEMRISPIVIPLKDAVIGNAARVLWTLFGGMVCLLAIALANSGGLFLIRAEHRRIEIAVRRALGADAVQIARLFFAEALALTVVATVCGLGLGRVFLSLVIALTPLPRATEIGLSTSVVVFAAVTAVLVAVFYATVSIRGQRQTLSLNSLGGAAWATSRRAAHVMRNPFVALQVALALTLMIGSALMVQTYINLSRRNLGFTSDGLLTVQVGLASGRYRELARIYDQLIERVRQLPGVEHAAATSFLPLTGTEDRFPVESGGEPVLFKFFTPGYFQVMRTTVLEGDGFLDNAPVPTARPVLISAALARRLFPGTRAVGQTLVRYEVDGNAVTMAGPVGGRPVPPFTIAGVVSDVRETALRDEPAEIVYVPVIDPPVEQSISPVNMNLVVRTQVPPLSLASAVRNTITSLDPSLSVGQTGTMDAIVQASRSTETFVGTLLLFAAAVSLFLGLVGIYGSVAHDVGRRTREIGIRLSLGARRSQVVRLVLGESVWPLLAGVITGLGTALGAAHVLRSLVFGVQPADLITFVAVTSGLTAAGCLAAVLAARRAARISPVLVLRGE